jgi:multiple sugar transport system ATP-binding protein
VFVAGFIGSPAMNMLPVSPNGPLKLAGAELDVDGDLGGERATIGFRPETVVIGDDGPIPARIRLVEDLGSEVFVHLVIDHEREERRLIAKVDPPFPGEVDDDVRLTLRGAVHMFDAAEVRRATATL